MEPKQLPMRIKFARVFITSICGVDADLALQMPHGIDHYVAYLQEEWNHTTKAVCLNVAWIIVALITLISFLFGHYLYGAVIFFGLIRLTTCILNVAKVDYLNSLNQPW